MSAAACDLTSERSPAARRGPGRPSLAAPFRQLVVEALFAERALTAKAIFERASAAGYAGEKSAMYALVAALRVEHGILHPTEVRAAARRQARAAAIAERVARLNEWERISRERRERKEREREERAKAAARAKEERARKKAGLSPLGTPEQPLAPDRLASIGRAWLKSREGTHKAFTAERYLWRRHLEPYFGDLRPNEVDVPRLKLFVEDRRAMGYAPGTIGGAMRLFSSLLTELAEGGTIEKNVIRSSMPRAVRRLYRKANDPAKTPFLETPEDIRRLRAELTGTLRALFSVGVLTGLRTGELLALEWGDVNFTLRRLNVQRRVLAGRVDTPKSGKSRIVPLSTTAIEFLKEWRAQTGPTRLVFPPEGRGRFVNMSRLPWHDALRRAGLSRMRFYECTRHTFASQWVMNGQPIEKLSKILGHSSIAITEVYAHLRPESMVAPDVISFAEAS